MGKKIRSNIKIMVFTEGTVLMNLSGKDVGREERVKQSQAAGIQREERHIAYDSGIQPPKAKKDSVYDLESYIPIGKAVEKLITWQKQGADICYLTSGRIKSEIKTIQKVLKKFNFPHSSNLFYLRKGEDYKDVAEKVLPDILVEDDCESIGGKVEMTYTHIKPKVKAKIYSIPVQEFGGIDHLPNDLIILKEFRYK